MPSGQLYHTELALQSSISCQPCHAKLQCSVYCDMFLNQLFLAKAPNLSSWLCLRSEHTGYPHSRSITWVDLGLVLAICITVYDLLRKTLSLSSPPAPLRLFRILDPFYLALPLPVSVHTCCSALQYQRDRIWEVGKSSSHRSQRCAYQCSMPSREDVTLRAWVCRS